MREINLSIRGSPSLFRKKKRKQNKTKKEKKRRGGEKLTALDSLINADSISKNIYILNNLPFEVLIQRAKCQSKQIKTHTYSLRWVHVKFIRQKIRFLPVTFHGVFKQIVFF